MSSHRSRTILVALCSSLALLALAPLATGDDAPKIAGTWDAVAATPQGNLPVVLTITILEGKPSCEVLVAAVKQTVSEEKLEADVLTMKVSYETDLYDVIVKASGDGIEGTWQGSGYSGTLTGTRRP